MPQWERARGGNEQRQAEPRGGPCFGMAGFKSEGLWTKLLISRTQPGSWDSFALAMARVVTAALKGESRGLAGP